MQEPETTLRFIKFAYFFLPERLRSAGNVSLVKSLPDCQIDLWWVVKEEGPRRTNEAVIRHFGYLANVRGSGAGMGTVNNKDRLIGTQNVRYFKFAHRVWKPAMLQRFATTSGYICSIKCTGSMSVRLCICSGILR